MIRALYILAIILISACGGEGPDITVLESDDGLVRVLGWEEPHDGTMGVYGSRIEYKWNGKSLTQEGTLSGAGEPMMPMKLYTLGDGKYILYQYFREWSSQGYIEATALELTAEGLMPVKLFEKGNGLVDNINMEYNTPDWYFRTNDGGGYDWLYYYDKASQTLYHPASPSGNFLSDRYIPYIWNGKTLSPGKEVANPFLHQSLSEYDSLVSLSHTERNLVRIDAMADGSFRYAVWAKSATMLDKPEQVFYKTTVTKF